MPPETSGQSGLGDLDKLRTFTVSRNVIMSKGITFENNFISAISE